MRGIKCVDLDAIRHNSEIISAVAGGRAVYHVVKADAYGHGALAVVDALRPEKVAVATAEEALSLSGRGIGEILLLGDDFHRDALRLVECGVSISVSSENDLAVVSRAAMTKGVCANVHVAVNTGMNRTGVKYGNTAYKLITECFSDKNIKLRGVYTHYYSPSDETVSSLQSERFVSSLGDGRLVRENGVVVHAAATFSAAFPERSFGGMRVGLGLYGYGVEGTLPAMEVKSSITRVNRLMAGDTVGYGGMFRAKRSCVVATVPVGYADGLYRSYTGGEVLVNGSFAKIVGNVCMDCCFVLVGEGAKPGDEVVFLGRQGAKEISAERIASKLGTIPYEVLTSFRRMNTIYCGFAPKSN